MKIKVTRTVVVEVTQEDIEQFRKMNRNVASHGVLKRDANVAQIIALNRSLELIQKLDSSVITETSLDDDADLKF